METPQLAAGSTARPCSTIQWRSPKEEPMSGEYLVAVHNGTISIAFKHELDALGLRQKLTAWCYQKDIVDSAILSNASGLGTAAMNNHKNEESSHAEG